jgi:hypothetical protein
MHRFLDGQKAREMETAGDGACALHAAFGQEISHSGQLTCEGARGILREVLGKHLDEVTAKVRLESRSILTSVASMLWIDFTLPFLRQDAAVPNREEGIFFKLLQGDDQLMKEAKSCITRSQTSQRKKDEDKRKCSCRTSEIFNNSLEELIWRRLGVQAGIMPGGVNRPHQLSSDELSVYQGADSSCDFLQAPWDILRGELVVKGSSPSMPYPCDPCDGPQSKYASLFDGRHEFNSLRYAFLDAVVGQKMESLNEVVGEAYDSFPEADSGVLLSFINDFPDLLRSAVVGGEEPADYATRAWPLYVQAISNVGYFLSCDELLLVCELCHKNCIIFGSNAHARRLRGKELE